MKRLLAFSSLLTLPFASTAGAVDVTLGSTLQLEVDFGVQKRAPLTFGAASSSVSIALGINGSTDAGLKYGGALSLGTSAELQISPYAFSLTSPDQIFYFKATVGGRQDLHAAGYSVSGGQAISEADIVSVKINSDWHGVDPTVTGYQVDAAIGPSDICKIAGEAIFGSIQDPAFQKTEVDTVLGAQTLQGELDYLVTLPNSGYMPPGKLAHIAGTMAGNSLQVVAYLEGTATINYFGPAASTIARIQLTAPSPISTTVPDEILLSRYNVDIQTPDATTPTFGARNASVFAGPVLSVKTVQGSEKLALGAVCVSGGTDTNYFLDVANDRILVRDAAQIFIEGGFGTVVLKTTGEAGGVRSIGNVGAKADISSTDLTLSYDAPGILGISPGLALNFDELGEVLAYTSIDLSGLFADIDFLIDFQPLGGSPIITSGGWELGAGYHNDFGTVQFGVDSDWELGLMAEVNLGDVSLYAETVSPTIQDHVERRQHYLFSATYEANDFTVSGSINEERRVTLDVSYDVAALSIYGDFDFMSREGRIGTKISF